MDSDNLSRIFAKPNIYSTSLSAHHSSFELMDNGSMSGRGLVRRRRELWVEDSRAPYHRVTIGSLPDDALLEIFNFYVDELTVYEYDDIADEFDVWHTLVHVCRRWRIVVFSSPRRLNLQLFCDNGRSVREMLDIWPELPIVIRDVLGMGDDETTAALKLNDRVSRIFFWDVSSSKLETYATFMQVPFPALTDLDFWRHKSDEAAAPVLSDEFLGGSAPHLQGLWLRGILFPALGKLLLSTTDLVRLGLEDIPHSGYISPEEMVACLAGLPRLDRLTLDFQSPLSRPSKANRRLCPPARTVLPALTHLWFKGVTEYLEDLVARIDVPLLNYIDITLFNQLLFDILQLQNLLFRADKLALFDRADVEFQDTSVGITFSTQSQMEHFASLRLSISCKMLDWQLSSLSQVCRSTLCALSDLEFLDIHETQYSWARPKWKDDVENIQWLELLQPFTSVKSLYLSKEVVSHVAPSLEELAREPVFEVLPALKVLFLDELYLSGPVQKALQEFVDARRLFGHPVGIQCREERM